ncbi:MAG TPA: MFS transporter [Pseudolabrys sp.]|nr:MFS transporter [Pseudolabrys sp.]
MPVVHQMRAGFAWRVACLYAALFAANGIQLPFFPVWLKAKGLDAHEIGFVLAVPMLARIIATPLATRLADRRDALREAIVLACALSVAGYLLVGLAQGATAIIAAFAFASLVYAPIMPITETYTLRGLSARGRAYGPVRLWGSAAFVAGTFLAGFATDVIAARHLIWLIFAGMVLAALSAVMLEPLERDAARVTTPVSPAKPLLRDKAFLAVIAAASLIQASHAVYYSFSALAWRGEGLDGSAIAALWALGVIAEIVLFALSARLPPSITPTRLLLIGAFGGALRWSAMAFNPPAAALPFLQVLHAATFGATHLGALSYLARHAPKGQAATAQGYLAIALAAAMAAATTLSGVLYQAAGPLSYAAMASIAVAGGLCALIAQRAGRVTAA